MINLARVDKNYVIKIKDFYVDDRDNYFITEVLQTNLLNYMNGYCNKLTEEKIKDVFHKFVQAVLACH